MIRKIVYVGVVLALVGLVVYLLFSVRYANGTISSLDADNGRLESENARLNKELSRFNGIDSKILLQECKKRAADEWLSYVEENSISTTDGNSTVHTPKSPDVLPTANKTQDAANKECEARFGT